MKVGVPKETVEGERRVALVPETVGKLVSREGFEVLVEAGAGRDYNPDEAYEEAGARIVADARELYGEADIVVKVGRATADEAELMHEGTLLVSFLAPHADPELIGRLAERGITAFGMELIPRIARAQSMDALSSMGSIAGYKSTLIAAGALGKYLPMMTTAAGTTKASRVLVLGAGVAGLQAIATSRRLGAEVFGFDIRPEVKEQIESLGAKFVEAEPEQPEPAPEEAPEEVEERGGLGGLLDRVRLALGVPAADARPSEDGRAQGGEEPEEEEEEEAPQDTGGYAREQAEEKQRRDRELIHSFVKEVDVVITTALIPGRPAPVLLTEEMVDDMPPGSLVVDLAAEAGGNCELTEAGKVVSHGMVEIHGPLNLPSTMPIHASQLFARNVNSVLSHVVHEGELVLDFEDEITDQAVVTHAGEVRHGPTREALGGEKAETKAG
ncbi:MAG: NAD(P) transhydrogenase subunit alpha [Actinomycetota bacterium]|nr:NAD(P) transhydrogenase subunit alpha [Actinomycetota bacterium]